jgi:ABC-type transport system involved in multi-copper enzyme maturation permease subunit
VKGQLWALAHTTYRDIFRYKVLWLAPFIFIYFVIMATVLWYMGAKGDAISVLRKVVENMTSLFQALGFLFALIVGATLISREIAQKTLHPVLLKPMPLGTFFCGKFLGAALFYAVSYGALAVFLFAVSWAVEGRPQFKLFAVYALMVMGLCAVAALTMALAQGIRIPMAAGASVFLMSILADQSGQILDILVRAGDRIPAWLQYGINGLLELVRFGMLAEDEFFTMSDLTSRGTLLWGRLAWAVPYGLVYAAAALAAGAYFFARHNRYRSA